MAERLHQSRVLPSGLRGGSVRRALSSVRHFTLLHRRSRKPAARLDDDRRGSMVLLLARFRVLPTPAPSTRRDRLRRRSRGAVSNRRGQRSGPGNAAASRRPPRQARHVARARNRIHRPASGCVRRAPLAHRRQRYTGRDERVDRSISAVVWAADLRRSLDRRIRDQHLQTVAVTCTCGRRPVVTRSRTPAPVRAARGASPRRSEEHTSELQPLAYLLCRLLLEKKKNTCLFFSLTNKTQQKKNIPYKNT